MARLIYDVQALEDLERLTDFLLDTDKAAALETITLITDAIIILQLHPLVGRAVESDVRELVISRGQSGYVALYHYDAVSDLVLILTIRHQREAGYPD